MQRPTWKSVLSRTASARAKRARRGARLAALLALSAACGELAPELARELEARAAIAIPAPTVAVETAAPASIAVAPPARLADTGLYSDFDARALAAGVLPFSPQYPLWSDGASKRRWIRLPEGSSIDASNPDVWSFPVGTRLWKEFAFERPVETRYMERRADGWLFATYAWNADASDAVLAPERGVKRARTEPSGARFDIPSRADCRVCHETGPSSVLGFSALQLSSDRDPLAPHAAPPDAGSVDLDELLERGLLASAPESWRDAPPRIEASTPRGRAALGYLSANCGQCHTADGALSELGLALDYPLARASRGAPALATAVGRTSSFRTPGARGDELRIAPGDPDASVLLARVRSKDALLRMPPLGTHVPDEAALLLLETWIREDLVASRGEDQLLIETASNR